MQYQQDEIIRFSREALKPEFRIDSESKIQELTEAIRYHEWRYYIINEPILSDTEYDHLFKLLEASELKHPSWKDPASPTLRVSLDLTENFETVSHLTPMLSLANSYDEQDLIDFDNQLRKVLKLSQQTEIAYSVEPKLDGGSISLVYEDDKLVRVITRGNGAMGENITANGISLKSIPLTAKFSQRDIAVAEVRGEALISKKNFPELNQLRSKSGQALFANPRNAATGGLRTKDPRETAARRIEAFIYTFSYAIDKNGNNLIDDFSSHYESIEYLKSLGFNVPTEARARFNNIQEVIAFCDYWQKNRESYPYEIDGMVVKVDARLWQEAAGFTAHHPRWAIAFKFEAKQAATKLLDVEFQIGRIGAITPVGKLAPVQLAGVTVSSVSLHNEDFIRSRELKIGDMVIVERAGDVIPYIVKNIPDLRTGEEKEIIFPTHCPSCNTMLIRPGEEAILRCPNPECPAQIIQKLIFFVSKEAMDIDGFGKSIVEKFYELGWIRSFADVFRLTEEKIAVLEGFGTKSAAKLIASIEKAKSNPINRLLNGLSIHHVGNKVAKLITANINSIFELEDKSPEYFESIPEIGPIVAKNIYQYFQDKSNVAQLKQLQELGVNMNQDKSNQKEAKNESHPLFNKTILFTGTLHQMTRDEAQELAEKIGAKNLSAVSKNLHFLVVGENAGSKLSKAKAIGTIQILTEDEFIALVRQ